MRSTYLLDLHVTNVLGALDQIALLVRRSGWNIQDIIASDTADSAVSRIVMHADGVSELRLLLNQLRRLECVLSVETSDSQELEEALADFAHRMRQIG